MRRRERLCVIMGINAAGKGEVARFSSGLLFFWPAFLLACFSSLILYSSRPMMEGIGIDGGMRW